MAYFRIEPWGDSLLQLGLGQVAATTFNVWRDKNQAPMHPWSVFPHLEPQAEAVGLDDPDRDARLLQVCKMWAGVA